MKKVFLEEVIREELIDKMINLLGYPKSFIVTEKKISILPHLKNEKKSNLKRRADIICFANNIHHKYELYPLLLIECKREKLTNKAAEQLLGYNHFIKAPFLALLVVCLVWRVDTRQNK